MGTSLPTQPIHSLAAMPQQQIKRTEFQTSGHMPEVLIVLLLLTIQPLAWYFMWKDRKYHRWFATILFFNSLLTILIPVILLVMVIPQLTQLYASLRITNVSTFIPQIGASAIMMISFGQLWYALRLRRIVKSHGELPKANLATVVSLLILSSLLLSVGSALVQLSVIIPLYGTLGVTR